MRVCKLAVKMGIEKNGPGPRTAAAIQANGKMSCMAAFGKGMATQMPAKAGSNSKTAIVNFDFLVACKRQTSRIGWSNSILVRFFFSPRSRGRFGRVFISPEDFANAPAQFGVEVIPCQLVEPFWARTGKIRANAANIKITFTALPLSLLRRSDNCFLAGFCDIAKSRP
jgi:hypothetical protein